MPAVTLACQFCGTKNKIDLDKHAAGPKCADCTKPFHLDRPVTVVEDDFDATVLKSEVPVLVDFHADWCGPCVMMAPLLDDVANEVAGKAVVAKVNTDASPTVSQKYGIRSIPFFARFENGEVVRTAVGAQSRQALLELANSE